MQLFADVILKAALSTQSFNDPEFWSGQGSNPRLPAQLSDTQPTELIGRRTREVAEHSARETTVALGYRLARLLRFPYALRPPACIHKSRRIDANYKLIFKKEKI